MYLKPIFFLLTSLKFFLLIVLSSFAKYTLSDDAGYLQEQPTDASEPYHFSMYQLSDIANNLQKSLFDIHDDLASMDLLTKRDGRVVAEEIDPELIIESFAEEIETLFLERKQALMKIVNVLEEESREYKWHDEISYDFSDVYFMNTTSNTKIHSSGGEMDDLFGIPVNKSVAGVHTPVEVYEGYAEIVNGLKWSSVADEVFKKNKEEYDDLSWQYFAGHDGFMRFYPSVARWYVPPHATVDLYDARMRPWYIIAASSAKDVIILMDRSGSVHGQTFTIMKFAIETLIDSLGENDYFNIAAFNETTSWVSSIVHEALITPEKWDCKEFNSSLIPSTDVNKKALKSDIQHLSVKGIANYSDALEFAFREFQKRGEQDESSLNCQRLIMLFSDGGTQWPDETLQKYINDSATNDIKIFTYAVGPHPIPTAVLKEMACSTGGKFTVITTSGGVRTRIQESYLGLVSNPLAVVKNHTFHYTTVYTSALTGNSTISISVPVFNSSVTLTKDKDAQLVGVAGTDVPTQQLRNILREDILGPIGYAFITNSNGNLVYHHLIKPHESYLDGTIDLDMLDLEVNTRTLREIRRKIIHGNKGTITFSGQILLDDFHVYGSKMLRYSYMPINGSPYSLVLFTLPPTQQLKIPSQLRLKTIDPRSSFLSTWNFCGVHPLPAEPDLLNKRILEENPQCNKDLLNTLMWAQEWTDDLVENWEKENSFADLINRIIYTRFGLSRSVDGPASEAFKKAPNKLLGTEWRDPTVNVALKRAILEDELFLVPHENGVLLSKPAYMNNIVTGVVGINLTSKIIDEKLEESISLNGSPMESSIFLLIDDAAVIIASSQHRNSSGEFLGRRWPLLLEKLVEADVYGIINVTNHQALCEKDVLHKIYTSGCTNFLFFHPVKMLLSFMMYLLNLMECFQCFFTQLFLSTISPEPVEGFFETKVMISCSMEHSTYYLTDRSGFSGNISCLGDSAQVLVTKLNSTNAILVVVEDSIVNLNCDGWKDRDIVDILHPSTSSSMSRYRMVHPKEIACQTPRERKRPDQCLLSASVPCSKSHETAPCLYLIGFLSISLAFTL